MLIFIHPHLISFHIYYFCLLINYFFIISWGWHLQSWKDSRHPFLIKLNYYMDNVCIYIFVCVFLLSTTELFLFFDDDSYCNVDLSLVSFVFCLIRKNKIIYLSIYLSIYLWWWWWQHRIFSWFDPVSVHLERAWGKNTWTLFFR